MCSGLVPSLFELRPLGIVNELWAQLFEIWILDVEGTRLVIASERSPGSPRRDLAELSAILDSIRIEP